MLSKLNYIQSRMCDVVFQQYIEYHKVQPVHPIVIGSTWEQDLVEEKHTEKRLKEQSMNNWIVQRKAERDRRVSTQQEAILHVLSDRAHMSGRTSTIVNGHRVFAMLHDDILCVKCGTEWCLMRQDRCIASWDIPQFAPLSWEDIRLIDGTHIGVFFRRYVYAIQVSAKISALMRRFEDYQDLNLPNPSYSMQQYVTIEAGFTIKSIQILINDTVYARRLEHSDAELPVEFTKERPMWVTMLDTSSERLWDSPNIIESEVWSGTHCAIVTYGLCSSKTIAFQQFNEGTIEMTSSSSWHGKERSLKLNIARNGKYEVTYYRCRARDRYNIDGLLGYKFTRDLTTGRQALSILEIPEDALLDTGDNIKYRASKAYVRYQYHLNWEQCIKCKKSTLLIESNDHENVPVCPKHVRNLDDVMFNTGADVKVTVPFMHPGRFKYRLYDLALPGGQFVARSRSCGVGIHFCITPIDLCSYVNPRPE